jgi:hypothetical protein
MSSRYHIVYPCGDRTKLSVVEIVDALSYELSEYAVASRNDWETYKEAATYAKQLAKDNDLTFVPDKEEPDYLD